MGDEHSNMNKEQEIKQGINPENVLTVTMGMDLSSSLKASCCLKAPYQIYG